MEFPAVIELNVGGKQFTTMLTTLMKDPDSMLAAMFSGRHPLSKDKDGRYFIDCDGNVFACILEYLRFETIPSGKMVPQLLKYADYFNIAALKADIEKEHSECVHKGQVIIGKTPRQMFYNLIFDALLPDDQNRSRLPVGVFFYTFPLNSSCKEVAHITCLHRIEWPSIGLVVPDRHIQVCSFIMKYCITDKLFDTLPYEICNDISKLGYVVKYSVCDCKPNEYAGILIFIGYSNTEQLDRQYGRSDLQWKYVST